jgi:hypothetical protein
VPEPTVMLLEECIERDATSGEVVTPRMLAERWGACPHEVRHMLDRLAREGRCRKRLKVPREGRKAQPYTIYWLPKEDR